MNNDFPIQKVHCNTCLGDTDHWVIAKRDNLGRAKAYPDDPFCEIEIDWETIYTMFECCGCHSVVLRKYYYFSEWDGADISFHPPRISRQIPIWHEQLPWDWKELLKECYSALDSGSGTLAVMGARALIDLFMNDSVGDIGGFARKLSELEGKGILSRVNREFIEVALEAGHAAAHRGHRLKKTEVNQVFDIVENLLQSKVLQEATASLRSRIPERG